MLLRISSNKISFQRRLSSLDIFSVRRQRLMDRYESRRRQRRHLLHNSTAMQISPCDFHISALSWRRHRAASETKSHSSSGRQRTSSIIHWTPVIIAKHVNWLKVQRSCCWLSFIGIVVLAAEGNDGSVSLLGHSRSPDEMSTYVCGLPSTSWWGWMPILSEFCNARLSSEEFRSLVWCLPFNWYQSGESVVYPDIYSMVIFRHVSCSSCSNTRLRWISRRHQRERSVLIKKKITQTIHHRRWSPSYI